MQSICASAFHSYSLLVNAHLIAHINIHITDRVHTKRNRDLHDAPQHNVSTNCSPLAQGRSLIRSKQHIFRSHSAVMKLGTDTRPLSRSSPPRPYTTMPYSDWAVPNCHQSLPQHCGINCLSLSLHSPLSATVSVRRSKKRFNLCTLAAIYSRLQAPTDCDECDVLS